MNQIQSTPPRTILLTGATGFVGRQVLRFLLKENVRIRCIVREGKESELPTSDQLDPPILTKDLFAEDLDWYLDCLRDVDTVLHLAWYAEPGKYQLSPKNLECLEGTVKLARAAMETGVRRFVGVGTCLEYLLGDEPLNINTPLEPKPRLF